MKITDLEPYRPHIDRFDLTEEQKMELIAAIQQIAHIVLDKHFRVYETEMKIKEDD
ncbi:MAG: hypothetical protein R3D71_09905 [Rickettsiales bacterium]